MDEKPLLKLDPAAPYGTIVEAIGIKPLEYETTGIPFWDDEHISKQMLAAHLDRDHDGASRTHAFMDRSVEWMLSFLEKEDGKILDLGCGPGLYAKGFSDQGHRVTGIDFSKRSIAYANAHFGDAMRAFIYQDYLTMEYDEDYDLALLIYGDFGVLSPENRRTLLQKVHRSLKPGGLFVVDAFTPYHYKKFPDALTVEYEDGGFWSERPYLNIKRNASYPNQIYLEQYTIITAESSATYNVWNKGFEQKELEESLLDAGFSSVVFYDDAAGAERTEESPVVCAVCRK